MIPNACEPFSCGSDGSGDEMEITNDISEVTSIRADSGITDARAPAGSPFSCCNLDLEDQTGLQTDPDSSG